MEEDWGSAARPHNVQGTCRRKRRTCAPRRGGRPVLAGIAEPLLEWGARGRGRRRRGGGLRVLRCSHTTVPASRTRGEEKPSERVRLLPDRVPSLAGPCRTPSPLQASRVRRRQERRDRGLLSRPPRWS